MSAAAHRAADPVVTTQAGRLQGRAHPHGVAFLGVPFAEPPFGPHRFAAPAPVAPWDGIRQADTFAPTAPQPAQGFTIIPEPTIAGGDAPACLSLNVFTPDLGGAELPVLVWIHGGGFVTGTPSSPWYDGRSFNRDGVVVVSVGYRLGAEGFLAIDGAPANRGVLDWLAALAWVQTNIAAFGGDPARVTVGGQSAGGGACATLATLPQATGLFHQVLAMSGTVNDPRGRDQAAGIARAVANRAGVAADVAGLAQLSPDQLVEAQDAAGQAGAAAADSSQGGARDRTLVLPFQPVLDGEVVATAPLQAYRDGATDHLPMLIGCTSQEFNAAMRGVEMDDDRLRRRLGRLGLSDVDAEAYRTLDAPSHGDRYGQAVTDAWFRVPAVRVTEARLGAPAPTYLYDFDWRSPALGGIGAVHCLDLPFAWDLLDAEGVTTVAGEHPPQALADRMHQAWVGFVAHGDPGWPAYRADRRATMVFDQDSQVVDDRLRDTRQMFP